VTRNPGVSIVRITSDGPLVVRGPILLVDEEGSKIPLRRRVNALCRCGRSTRQPFCDGTHKIVPFSPRSCRTDDGALEEGSPPVG
jgi:CDGSH-type Zn-finger protein